MDNFYQNAIFYLVRLGLHPHHIWSLSLTEYRAIIGKIEHQSLQKTELENLMNLYPDKVKDAK